jgi:hypothetical protein
VASRGEVGADLDLTLSGLLGVCEKGVQLGDLLTLSQSLESVPRSPKDGDGLSAVGAKE